MPIYEQKLISPLAVRFTQEHIRTTFRDGRSVEASCAQIVSRPGVGAYDVLLAAPFPNIEIVRWRARRVRGLAAFEEAVMEGDAGPGSHHWFTLDNRRLYCLQRAAAALWPLRVGVVVDLLYADPGSIRRKLDSSTGGRSVSIGHSSRGPELKRWNWREEVGLRAAEHSKCPKVHDALEALRSDDSRVSVEALHDAPGAACGLPSLLERFEAAEFGPQEGEGAGGCATPSTAASSEEETETRRSSMTPSVPPSAEEALFAAVKGHLAGAWCGSRGELYRFRLENDRCWKCVRWAAGSSKAFTVSYDVGSGLIWWGLHGAYFLSAIEVVEKSGMLRWYEGKDSRMRRPKFVWPRQPEPAPVGHGVATATPS